MPDLLGLIKDISGVVQKYNDMPLMKQLIELQSAVFEQQQELQKLTKELASAKDQLELQSKLKLQAFGNSHYYVKDGESVAYCPVCYGQQKQLIPLPINPDLIRGTTIFGRQCPACKSNYNERERRIS